MLAVAATAALRRLSPPARVSSMPGWAVLRSPAFAVSAALAGFVGGYWLGPREGLPAAGVAVFAGLVIATFAHLVRTLSMPRPKPKVDVPPAEGAAVVAGDGPVAREAEP